MSYRVEVQPSGRSFEAQPGESLLEAGLRSGLNIQYNCSSGSCGECRARLLSGELKPHRHGDYRLSEAERAQGDFLLCTHAAGSDLRIEALEAGSAADIPLQRINTKVRSLEPRGDNMLLLTLRTPRSQTLRFLAGQHVQLSFEGGPSADLALAGCPCNGMELEFHIARDPGSAFHEQLFSTLRRGDSLLVEGPYGEFTLDESSARPLLFIAEGQGFAAIKSLVEHEMALDSGRPIYLYWLAGESGHYRANLCRSWGDAVDELEYRPLNSIGELETLEGLERYDIYVSVSDEGRPEIDSLLLARGADSGRMFHLRTRTAAR